MRRLKLGRIFPIIVALLVVLLLMLPGPAQANDTAEVSIPDATVASGGMVTVPINITDVTNLGTATVWLSYDKDVVIVDSVADGNIGAVTYAIYNADGVTKMTWYDPYGKTGDDYIFASVTLHAVGNPSDTSPLDLEVKEFVDVSLEPIEHSVDDGWFTIAIPKTIYVDDDFTDDPANHKWDTIQEGIDDALDGDTVIVYEGSYYENVEVNKSITLKGEGMPVVDAEGSGSAITVTADGCTVEGFKVTRGGGTYSAAGIMIESESDNNVIKNITAENNCTGIFLEWASSNKLSSITAIGNSHYGVHVSGSEHTLDHITAENNGTGIWLYSPIHITLRENVMRGNGHNFGIYGKGSGNYRHDIDTSNTVDGKPIYYLVDEQDVVIDSSANAGYVAAISSSNVTVRDLALTNNGEGVLFVSSEGSRIENVTTENNGTGIDLRYSSGNILTNITAKNNGVGLYLTESSNNTLSNIATEDNGHGIWLHISSDDNTLSGITVTKNEYKGILLGNSSGNLIYHNNLIDNEQNAYDDTGTSSWDNGSEGNYWSDYKDKYPDAEEVDETGIWDMPYEIPGDAGAKDNYPLMQPFSIGIGIEPAETMVAPEDIFSANIQIFAGDRQVDGAQVFLDFDPTYLEVTGVTPGTALPVTMWDPPYFDNSTGQIRYAAGAFSDFPSGTFTLATIEFTALQETPEEGTSITFVFNEEAGRMTKIVWQGENFTVEPVVDGTVRISAVPPPEAAFTATPTVGLAPLTVEFTDESTGEITSWSWDLGNDTTVEWTPETRPADGILTPTYTEIDIYNVTLTVTGPGGSDSDTATITACGAKFTAQPISGAAPLSVQFTDQSVGATSWEWDFGDDETSEEQSPSHTYTEVGVYDVTLTIYGIWGADPDVETKEDYISVGATLKGKVYFQGEAAVAHDLIVTLRLVGQEDSTDYPVTADAQGNFEIHNLIPGTYDMVGIDGTRVLRNVAASPNDPDNKPPISLSAPETTVDFGELREGDVDDDGDVDMDDFNLLWDSFGIMTGGEGYNDNANFDRNNIVDITDFSLLRRNFGDTSDAW